MYDTITLDNTWNTTIPPLATAQIPSLTTGPYPTLNVGAAGTYSVCTSGSSGTIPTSGFNGTYFTTNGTSGSNWATITTNNQQSSLNVHGDAEFEGKVKINGQDLGEFMETISKRLAILVPDPEKLEHFEALKKAYEHYKMLEKLCELPKEEKE
jgi:hypothetical protein